MAYCGTFRRHELDVCAESCIALALQFSVIPCLCFLLELCFHDQNIEALYTGPLTGNISERNDQHVTHQVNSISILTTKRLDKSLFGIRTLNET